MSLRLGDTAPDFSADSTEGPIQFHQWIGDHWAILFSHPRDFTPVCTTELGYVARLKPEFDKRGVRCIGLSIDPVDSPPGLGAGHPGDPGPRPQLPDRRRPRAEGGEPLRDDASGPRRGLHRAHGVMITYPQTCGRNFDEILRVINSLQLTDRFKVATPVNWTQGQDVIIVPAVTDQEAKGLFPKSWKALEPYLRLVSQPK